MKKLLAVIERDLRKFRRNPVVMGMSVLLPIVYLLILGNSFQGKLYGLPVAVINKDGGQLSRRIIENLNALDAGPSTLSVVYLKDEKEAIEGVKDGIYKAALIIPPDFTKKSVFKKSPEVGLFLDNTDTVSSETVRNSIEGAIKAIGTDYIPIRDVGEKTYLRDVNLYGKVDYYQSLVPGVLIMAIFLGTMTTGAFNLVMDRFLGIEESYLLTPLSRAHIVAGLIISGLLITTTLSGFVLAVSMLITGIPLLAGVGRCVSIFVIVVLTTLGLLSMMSVIMGRISHPRIVGILSGFLNVMLFFPSGAVYPIESFPGWLKGFAKVNPETYAVRAMKAILFKGAGISAVSWEIAYLGLFTALMMALAIVTFKRTV
jgi:ABC-2 type transport system permease protein